MDRILADDMVLEVTSFLPPLTKIRFLSTCKKFWNLRSSAQNDDDKSYHEYTTEEQWDKVIPIAFNRKCIEMLEFLSRIEEIPEQHWNVPLLRSCTAGDILSTKICSRRAKPNMIYVALQIAREEHNDALIDFLFLNQKDDQLDFEWKEVGLKVAASGNDKELVDYFVQKGASNFMDPLFCACSNGHLELAKYFLEHNFISTTEQYNEALSFVSGFGLQHLVQLCVDKGANEWDRGMTHAARGGHTDLVHYFIQQGATEWNAGLVAAALADCPELIKLFLEKGARMFLYALGEAINASSFKAIEYLTTERVNNPTMWDVAICVAVGTNNHPYMEMAVAHGAKWGKALDAASDTNNEELIRMVIMKTLPKKIYECLCIAIKHNLQDLVEAMWNTFRRHFKMDKAMEVAAKSNNMPAIEFLMSKGAKNWNAGLHGACRGTHPELAKFFIAKGAWSFNDCISTVEIHASVLQSIPQLNTQPGNQQLMQLLQEEKEKLDWFRKILNVAAPWARLMTFQLFINLVVLLMSLYNIYRST